MKMNFIKYLFIILFALSLLFPVVSYTQDSITNNNPAAVSKLFYKIDKNSVGSFKYNYGLNYVAAGLATAIMIKCDVDWNWYRYTYRNKPFNKVGNITLYTGYTIPFAAPIGLYLYGYMEKNTDLQVAGLALGQSALLGWLTSAAFKVFTGRVAPIKLSDPDDVNGDFRFGFLKGGINDGWPSGHTSTALAMATTLCELYPDNTVLHIGAFTYASLIGLGVSSRIHWASDVFSGALIGYAVGKTVGMSFKKLMKKKEKAQAFNFSVAPSGAAFNYSF